MDSKIDTRGKELLDFCIIHQFRVLNGRTLGDLQGNYTCYTPNGESVVDYAIVSEGTLDDILYFRVSDFIPTLSDCHCKIEWEMSANYSINPNLKDDCYVHPMPERYIWSEDSVGLFQDALSSAPLKSEIYNFLNITDINTERAVNDAAASLANIFTHAADISLRKSIKKKGKRNIKHKKWYNTELRYMRQHLVNYGKIYSKFPKDPQVKNHFYKLYREYNKQRKFKRKEYKNNLLHELESMSDNNPKQYWSMLNELQEKQYDSSNDCIPPSKWLKHFQGLNEGKEKFRSRVNELENKLKILEKEICFNELDFPISEKEIDVAISQLKLNKSPGLDNVSNNMIKSSKSTLTKCFKKVFNACLSSGVYPSSWAEGYITPLYKANDIADPSNYRGLTITSSIGKLFNRVLNMRLDKFLVKYKIIDDSQIGFKQKARTSDHMFVLKTIIDKYCNRKDGRVYACFVDFQKAYDTVIHAGIKIKLLEMGVGTLFYNTIKSMYSVSKSCIKVNNVITDSYNIKIGVKQGDNLSPNLFNIFMNELPKYLKESDSDTDIVLNGRPLNCLLYADDIILLSKSPEGLQKKINILNDYCNDWCLTVNTNKTKVLIFNRAGRLLNHSFKVNDGQLECVSRYKYLGITFCSSGSFTIAQEELYKKALKAYFKFSKDLLSLNPSVKTSMHVFDHTITSIMLYGCEIWGMFNPFTSKYRNGIVTFDRIYDKCPAEKLHQKFCKYILGVHSKATNFAVLSELGRLPMYYNIVKSMVKYYYRFENACSLFPLLSDAFIESNIQSDSNKVSWCASLKYILNIIRTTKSKNTMNSHVGSKDIMNHFLIEWNNNLKKHADGKLSNYMLCKNNFGCEKYLSIINNFELRRSLTRLRLSAHSLKIEKGRYQGIPRHDRTCSRCSGDEVEDEIHFLLHCHALNDRRNKLLSCIEENCSNFKKLDSKNKFIWLMNVENKEILSELCIFIKNNEKTA